MLGLVLTATLAMQPTVAPPPVTTTLVVTIRSTQRVERVYTETLIGTTVGAQPAPVDLIRPTPFTATRDGALETIEVAVPTGMLPQSIEIEFASGAHMWVPLKSQ